MLNLLSEGKVVIGSPTAKTSLPPRERFLLSEGKVKHKIIKDNFIIKQLDNEIINY